MGKKNTLNGMNNKFTIKLRKPLKSDARLFVMPQHNLKQNTNIYDELLKPTRKDKAGQLPPPKPKKPKNISRPPPIITDMSTKIDEVLKSLQIDKYQCKIMSIGTKVFLEKAEDHAKLYSSLKQSSIEHYTFSDRNSKPLKVVLSGLPCIPTDDVTEELKQLNITPINVYQMTTRTPNPHRALFLLHLKHDEVSMNDLNKINTICHTRVSWAPYRPSKRGPTQCNKCSMYGHGARNCGRKAVCFHCASNEHDTKTCPLKQDISSHESNIVYKCHYCISHGLLPMNHRANDKSCPGRQRYVDIKQVSNSSRRGAPVPTRQNLPKQHIGQHDLPRRVVQPGVSFSNVLTGNVTADNNTNGGSESESLFNTAELFNIFSKAINDMRKCKNKLDQLQVIASLLSHAV